MSEKTSNLKDTISNIKENYSEQIFMDYIQDFKSNKLFRCIYHDDKGNPNMSYNKSNNTIHCFNCNKTADIFNLMEKMENKTNFISQYNFIVEKYNIKTSLINDSNIKDKEILEQDNEPYYIPSKVWNEYKADLFTSKEISEYLKSRNIDIEKIKNKNNIGYDKENKTIIFANYGDTNGIQSYTARKIEPNTQKKDRYKKQGKASIFNSNNLTLSDNIFIVEGQIDSISIDSLGYHSISLGSTGFNIFINLLKEYIDYLKDKTYIIALDNDDAGKKASKELYKALKDLKIDNIYIANNLYNEYKDANDILINDEQIFKNKLEQYSKNPYKAINSVSAYMDDFTLAIKDSIKNKPIQTGYPNLDKVLNGGLYKGLYVLGAMSSLGKTTYILQLADQVAKQGQDVLIFSLEMSKQELMAKSVSRNTFKIYLDNSTEYTKQNCKTTIGILDGARYPKYNNKEKSLINEAIKEYQTITDNLYIVEAQDDLNIKAIRGIVKRHIKATGKAPVIILDYLQILPPYDLRMNDKQATDQNVKGLKTLSRDFNAVVIAISSLNRDSYKSRVSMSSFKESGGIEYGCDVLIGLQFTGITKKTTSDEIAEKKQKDIRDVEISIIKNRNGVLKDSIKYQYFTLFNYFEEK